MTHKGRFFEIGVFFLHTSHLKQSWWPSMFLHLWHGWLTVRHKQKHGKNLWGKKFLHGHPLSLMKLTMYINTLFAILKICTLYFLEYMPQRVCFSRKCNASQCNILNVPKWNINQELKSHLHFSQTTWTFPHATKEDNLRNKIYRMHKMYSYFSIFTWRSFKDVNNFNTIKVNNDSTTGSKAK